MMDAKTMVVLLGICLALLSMLLAETEAADCGQNCVVLLLPEGYTRVCWPRKCTAKRDMGVEDLAMNAMEPKLVLEPFPSRFFTDYDMDRDHGVSLQEFAATALLKDVKQPKETAEMLDHLDANKDGKLTCGEFLKAKLNFGQNKPSCS